MDETERVLGSNKFGLSKQEVAALVNPIFETAEIVVPQNKIDVIHRCPADNRVLELRFGRAMLSPLLPGIRKI